MKMRKTIPLLLALSLSTCLAAQIPGVINRTLDTCFVDLTNEDLSHNIDEHSRILYPIDIDGNGDDDLMVILGMGYLPESPLVFLFRILHRSLSLARITDEEALANMDLGLAQHYVSTPNWRAVSVEKYNDDCFYDTTKTFHFAIRREVVDEEGELHYCYGWLDGRYRARRGEPHTWPKTTFCIERMYYCTIPDYPLRYGQTSIGETDIENIVIRPNPTDGVFTVSGMLFREAVVYDITGKKVAQRKNPTGMMTLDLTGLGNGIYLVVLTDNDGDRHLKKIAKR